MPDLKIFLRSKKVGHILKFLNPNYEVLQLDILNFKSTGRLI